MIIYILWLSLANITVVYILALSRSSSAQNFFTKPFLLHVFTMKVAALYCCNISLELEVACQYKWPPRCHCSRNLRDQSRETREQLMSSDKREVGNYPQLYSWQLILTLYNAAWGIYVFEALCFTMFLVSLLFLLLLLFFFLKFLLPWALCSTQLYDYTESGILN